MTGRRSLQIHKKAVVDVDMVAKLAKIQSARDEDRW